MTKVAINGLGRIGRQVFRIAMESDKLELVAVNASYPAEDLAHLINYDSTHGKWDKVVEAKDEDTLVVEGKEIKIVSDRNPENLPWKDLGVDIVFEATGAFNHGDTAVAHINAGAKKVVLTGPSKGGDVQTLVLGVNDDQLDVEKYDIFSNASCTTNCLAPVAKVLNNAFGIKKGLVTTVHAYTSDQNILDNPHKDLRRARSAADNIVPTSTGAAKATALVLPELEGKLDGLALRVPTPNVSLVDLVVELDKTVTKEEVNKVLEEAANGELKGILEVTHAPLVSRDFYTNPHSSIVDASLTMVIGDSQVKVLSWYDNEWGYSTRTVELVEKVAESL
ncbi:type I glyceraldehyde-3-phosphate dehydrogenase [Phocicoccus pinnipedialis]|uniref:Glyceraldehyde-3-phosphate dehydrogenase n=1 Tax=Phocicoccus pinnipedialis TaxID=110845 RepID=A0A6V7RBX2_9BACL|nr:type I glyceraldehyde-3-phosphate dehydrogenase [Jeotgalicoccus pinnipedialis]MBP1939487.1 glyceraldehyde 3-phosphate dehydrogenase [Jeotgalicoccus pinnipedialis]CAD2075186.1 Glyceraldehyde-3-phosphate dehydrogenase 2 [Jeotgalicoccus pinnipedialis]